KYRYYDAANIERLKQIMVLRKMEIPIKDILRIYESEDMSTVVEAFVHRINEIDEEIGALAELKRIVNEFLQTMLDHGVTNISALPLLYDEMDKQLALIEERQPVTAEDLHAVSEKLAKPLDISMINLPAMRVISSYLNADPQATDPEGFSRFVQASGIVPGNHERFEFQTEAGDVMILRVPDDYTNKSDYLDYQFNGGLFAAAQIYLDEDLGERFRLLVKGFDENKYYQVDYENSRHAMLENLISPDDQRELVALLVPVKKRLADPALFAKPEEITDISVEEIEAQNPALWTVDVKLDQLTPINDPHYKVLKNGEIEVIGWILTRVLNTNVNAKLPFRVDMDFRVGEQSNPGLDDGSVRLYHGNHGLDHSYPFGINEEGVFFHQPVFRDLFKASYRGKIHKSEYNHLTWIIGEKHLAVILNGEVCYCGVNFPYMQLDLSREETRPIIFGAGRKKYFRSIRVSQLAATQKNKMKSGELTMITKQSNNIIPVIHRLITDEYGENYWFNGCAKYVMECLNEPDYDYRFFAGLTGDLFTQHYAYGMYTGDALTSFMMDEDMGGQPAKFVEELFAKCGYAATYVSYQDMQKNTEMYANTIAAYIDKGIPVIAYGSPLVGVIVGYEDYGKTLLYITGNKDQPERTTLAALFSNDLGEGANFVRCAKTGGMIFVGEKKESRDLAALYREAIAAIPQHMSVKTDLYCFGAQAFRAWADDIENGKFDGMHNMDAQTLALAQAHDESGKRLAKSEEFDHWGHYANNICVLFTNGCCCHDFLKRARKLNPDMKYLKEISKLYKQIHKKGDELESLGGGFNVTLETLQDKEKRAKIAAKIRECAGVMDEVLRVLEVGLK
ncbi:MAG: hypothetical protein FWE92_04165, partial [Defluviitaleaceae bacterium]|nr:hypothetical protein [Defluviitaleaceae bacterium]